MASHLDFGKKGEQMSRQFLESKGYAILKENWRFKHKEVDLICKDENILVFVEVKTRSGDYFQKPYEAVETKKQKLLIEAAEAFILEFSDFTEIRFDIVSIVQKPNATAEIEHIINAFTPGLDH
jgi:putative endonuclease